MIKILLADDHPVVGVGTKSILESELVFEVTVVNTAMDALQRIGRESFDLFLFDLNMPFMNGLELTKRVAFEHKETPILIFLGFEAAAHFNLLVEAGASGFVSKASTKEQLANAINCALRGETIIPISLFKQLRRQEALVSSTICTQNAESVSINEREQLILQEVAKGKSNREIAETLLMSQRTVEYSLTGIFGKLNVKSRTEAIVEAKKYCILPSEVLEYSL